MIAAVAEAALVLLIERRIRLEVSADQVVRQHLEACVK
jgi:hypothetical protein